MFGKSAIAYSTRAKTVSTPAGSILSQRHRRRVWRGPVILAWRPLCIDRRHRHLRRPMESAARHAGSRWPPHEPAAVEWHEPADPMCVHWGWRGEAAPPLRTPCRRSRPGWRSGPSFGSLPTTSIAPPPSRSATARPCLPAARPRPWVMRSVSGRTGRRMVPVSGDRAPRRRPCESGRRHVNKANARRRDIRTCTPPKRRDAGGAAPSPT